jgi:transcriptional regulator with XRE-family HTH domain
MGSASRRKPERLGEKLLEVRQRLGLSQNGMIRCLGLTDELTQAHISLYESGSRVPSLPVLLEYAAAANIYLEVLVRDDVNLPDVLPASAKSEGKKRSTPQSKRRKS